MFEKFLLSWITSLHDITHGQRNTRRFLITFGAASYLAATLRMRRWLTGIEDNLHGQGDMTFGEDQCRPRKVNSDANFSILRRTALTLLKNESTAKIGIKNKRPAAGWSEDHLTKVLFKQ